MKANTIYYKNYPWHIIFISNFVSILIYIAGALILAGLGLLVVYLYIAYIVILEIRLLKVSCTKCCYYNRFCAFGKGKLSALIFKKKDPALFQAGNFNWYSLLPDMLVLFIPLLAGIYLLIFDFNWLIPILMVLLIGLGTFGNGYIRGSLACNHCKQKELGCLAEQFFNKDNK